MHRGEGITHDFVLISLSFDAPWRAPIARAVSVIETTASVIDITASVVSITASAIDITASVIENAAPRSSAGRHPQRGRCALHRATRARSRDRVSVFRWMPSRRAAALMLPVRAKTMFR